jgi:transposase
VFIDEFSVNTAMTRTHARAPKGERAEVIEPFNRGNNISCIGALSLSGFQAPMMIEGAFDTQVFDLYIEHFLVPTLVRGDIVILDNVKFHHSQRAAELIRAAGGKLVHLPAYSPDFNPIEECFSKIKEYLRSSKARTIRKLYNAMKKVIEQVSVDDIYGWFAHCGYS